MGLDHGLIKRPKPVDTELVTWRKEWWLRHWFCDWLQHFQDNGETKVTCEDLRDLIGKIDKVLRNPEKYREEFPLLDEAEDKGEFLKKLRELKLEISKIIMHTDWENEEVIYWEWY